MGDEDELRKRLRLLDGLEEAVCGFLVHLFRQIDDHRAPSSFQGAQRQLAQHLACLGNGNKGRLAVYPQRRAQLCLREAGVSKRELAELRHEPG